MKYFILDGHNTVECNDIVEWSKCFESSDRVVAKDTIDGVEISTVFLGIDHSFLNGDRPLLFETMVFGGKFDGRLERCSAWSDAEEMHKHMVTGIREYDPE